MVIEKSKETMKSKNRIRKKWREKVNKETIKIKGVNKEKRK